MTDRDAAHDASDDRFDDVLGSSIRRHHARAGLGGSLVGVGGPDGLDAVLRRVDARRARRRTTAVVGSFAAVGAGVVGLAMMSGGGDGMQPLASGVGSTTPAPTLPSQRTIPAGQDVWECLEQIDYHGDEAVDSKFYVSCTPVTLPVDSPLVPWTPVDGEPALVDQMSTVPDTTAPVAGSYYVVQEGDTLAGIAVDFGVTESAIVDINQQRGEPVSEPLTPGDEILIPVYGSAIMVTTTTIEPAATITVPSDVGVHVVAAGDTPSSVAEQYGVTIEALAAANAGNPAYSSFLVGSRIDIPSGSLSAIEQTYTVLEGDSLFRIAELFDVDVDVLVNYNGWPTKNHVLLVGDVIKIPPNARIPGTGTPADATSTTTSTSTSISASPTTTSP